MTPTAEAVALVAAAAASPLISGGVVLFFMKKWFGSQTKSIDSMASRMDCFEQSQHACQLANAKDFATWDAYKRLDDKVDGHETRISRLEAGGQRRG